jgi:pimeloyl-ACP methyl ester carboxylesterase
MLAAVSSAAFTVVYLAIAVRFAPVLRAGTALRGLAAMLALTATATVWPQEPPLWATVPVVPALPTPQQSGYVDHDGAHLYYAAFNRRGGSPVILLHGGFASSDSWGFEVPLLAGRHEVIVTDARGHGRSTLPPVPLSYALMAADVVAVMDALDIGKASVVGLSDGGIVGLILGFRYPERVDKLFIWGASFDTQSDSTAAPDPAMKGMGAVFMARAQAQYRAVSPTPDGFAALRAALIDLGRREPDLAPAQLASIKAKTVIADGEHEQFIARAHTARLAALIPGSRLLVLPNVSHGGPQQDPAGFHAAVAALLDAEAPR